MRGVLYRRGERGPSPGEAEGAAIVQGKFRKLWSEMTGMEEEIFSIPLHEEGKTPPPKKEGEKKPTCLITKRQDHIQKGIEQKELNLGVTHKIKRGGFFGEGIWGS